MSMTNRLTVPGRIPTVRATNRTGTGWRNSPTRPGGPMPASLTWGSGNWPRKRASGHRQEGGWLWLHARISKHPGLARLVPECPPTTLNCVTPGRQAGAMDCPTHRQAGEASSVLNTFASVRRYS